MIKGLELEVLKRNGEIFETNLYIRFDDGVNYFTASGSSIDDIKKVLKKIKRIIKNTDFDDLCNQAKYYDVEDWDEIPFEEDLK